MIRAMTLQDLDIINEIENEAFSHPWSKEDFEAELQSNPYALYYVLEIDEKIVGYVGLWLIYEKAQITTIAVDQKYRGQKHSKTLMKFVDELCQKNEVETLSLEVRVSNYKAIKLYESFGLKTQGLRKDYYQDNHEDAYLMIKEYKGE